MFCELVKYGNVLEMHVCDNVGDHLIGNVYARFDWEDEAAAAVEALNKRWYAGTLIPLRSPMLELMRDECFFSRSTTLCGIITRNRFQRSLLSSE